MAGRPGLRSRPSAVALAAGLVALLTGSAVAGPLPGGALQPAAPSALPPGSVETPGSNELVSTPQQDRGALSATPASRVEDLFGPPTISASGRFVVFLQWLGPRGENQVVLRDRREGKTTVLDGPNSNGDLQHPTISADGRWIAYTRSIDGPDPTEVVLVERTSGSEVPLPSMPDGYYFADQPSLSGDGTLLAVRAAASGGSEVLLLDRSRSSWEIVSVDVNGRPTASREALAAQPALSADGRYVTFTAESGRAQLDPATKGNRFRQVFLRDRIAGRTTTLSRAPNGQASNGIGFTPAIDADGGVVAFASIASDLVPGVGEAPAHVYAWSAATGQVELVSRASDGSPGNDASAYPAVTADGGSVAFASLATNLVPGDTTGGTFGTQPSTSFVGRAQIVVAGDIFVRQRAVARTSRVSAARGNDSEANGFSLFPSISGTGRYVAFTSAATNLVQADRNEVAPDVFVRDRPPRLEAGPNPVDFGAAALGSLGTTRPATIRSTGVTAARIDEISIGGANAGDFVVAANPCSGQVLAPGAACEVQVLFVGTAQGDRKATLRIANDAGDPVTLGLIGTVGKAQLKVEPPQGPAGLVVTATGTGFPPNAPIELTWSKGITATPMAPVVSDASGSFVAQVLVLPRDQEGRRNLRAVASVPGVTVKAVTAPFLVVPSTAGPPTSGLVQVFATLAGEPIILRR